MFSHRVVVILALQVLRVQPYATFNQSAGHSIPQSCEESRVRRRRRQGSMCACRRRSGSEDVDAGGVCAGDRISVQAIPAPTPSLRATPRPTMVADTSAATSCSAADIRRRRRNAMMCACRRRTGTADLEAGWSCDGTQVVMTTAPSPTKFASVPTAPAPPPALRATPRPTNAEESSDKTTVSAPAVETCSPTQVRRRRRHASMCSCRRRSGFSDLEDGWSCEGTQIVMSVVTPAPTAGAEEEPSATPTMSPTPPCSEAMVLRRRRQASMCSCRRRSDGSDLGAGWACLESRLSMPSTPPPTRAPTFLPTPPTMQPTPWPTLQPTPAPPIRADPIRFLSYNVYVFTLRHRLRSVVSVIHEIAPQIASIQELWHEKEDLLQELIHVSNQSWDFARGGRTETVNDADILFRSDIWELLDSGLLTYGAGRGTNWAALRRRSDLAGILVYGTHPQCCRGEGPVLPAMEMSVKDMKKRQRDYPFPVAFMGDFNVGYFGSTHTMLREGAVQSLGHEWTLPMRFVDAVARFYPDDPDTSTIHNAHVRLDYVYFERPSTALAVNMMNISGARVWQNKGGSDHRPVSGDVILG
eukprot:TRINITY_DN19549_c0_g1_i1.p1 TRINITY_DN19549_c0_g1~~TRINITY_DN19549_c0_g1_i1.p1  ORF type:complete len:584 (-),score=36.44 TRINITY_DN19549_c0_g1_i1:357-2108(-)